MHTAAYLLSLLLLSGCGGFRGGIESVPYAGDIEPQETSTYRPRPREVILPGLTLHLSLNNKVQTYQYEVMLYVLPTYLNFRDEFQHREAENLECTLQIMAHDSGVTIDPGQLVLHVDGRALRPTAVWVNNRERERKILDAYIKARHQGATDRPLPVPHPAQWRDAVAAPVTVRPREQSPRFIVTFPVPLQSPERTLSLDVGRAIGEPGLFNLPLIQFESMRWSEGYS